MATDWQEESKARKAAIAATLESMKLTVESRFIPFSQSRNKGEKSPSLNWVVTVKRNGRDILTTDYMAGMGHCPSYNRKAPAAYDRHPRNWQPYVCAFECEEGFSAAQYVGWMNGLRRDKDKPIKPDPIDVIYSLVMDSSVLDSGDFENWASELGYETDSRKAESIYRACLDIALKLRGAIGDSGMATLQTAYQDY